MKINYGKNSINSAGAYPVLFDKKSHCCGCGACYAICVNQAITMEADFEGFKYPVINNQKCVRCYQCVSICPVKT